MADLRTSSLGAMLAAACLLLIETVQASAGPVASSAAESPAWRGRSAEAAPSSGCAECDAFAGDEGFFSVAVNCMSSSITSESRLLYFRDEQWVSTQLRGCLTALISSLGGSRQASFFRQGLPAETTWSLPGVVVGRRTGAVVAGACAFDADFSAASRARHMEEYPVCADESSYAERRIAVTDPLCGTVQEGAMQTALGTAGLNCRFSGLEAMAQQFEAFHRDSACGRSWYHNQVSLRYGIDDVTGVIFNSPEHEPIARDFALWLRELTGREISLVRTTKDKLARCECVAVPAAVAVPHPLHLPQLGSVAHISGGVCSEHWCDRGLAGHPPCCPYEISAPEMHPSLNQQPHYHPVFLHIPKSGGSSIECLTKDWDKAGIWTNMGHASFPAVSQCASRAAPLAQSALIISVRNPFDYWLSVYEYAKYCIRTNTPQSFEASYLQKRNATDRLATFTTFMRYMDGESWARDATQSHHIERSCGSPCNYEFLLRTETLGADWLALLGTLQLPLRPLSHVNVANAASDSETRRAGYTPELAQIVLNLEAQLFDEYGYSREL